MDMLRGLSERGHNVSLICRRGTSLAEGATSRGFTTFPIRIGGDLDPLVIWQTRKLMKENGIQVVLTNTDKDLRFAGLAAKLAGVNGIIACREVDVPIKNTFAYRLAYNWIATAIAVNSEATRHTLADSVPWLDGRRIRVIYKGISTDQFQQTSANPLHDEFGISPDSPVVCFVGRLDEQKGIVFLLDAWKHILIRHPEARLVLVGDGNLRDRVRNYVDQYGLAGSVHLAGFRKDVPHLLSRSTLLVLPSLWEGFGYAAVEAMAAGLPVVATATSSLPEVVEDGKTGILVEPRNSRAIADAVTGLLNNITLARRLGEFGRRRVRERFSLNAMLSAFETLFQEQLG
jgi:glycosyltransferase involved in cell wall biosynthesis